MDIPLIKLNKDNGRLRVSLLARIKRSLYSIIGRAIFLFIFLITVIVISAVYSTHKENEDALNNMQEKLNNSLATANFIVNNEVDRLAIISDIIKEENDKFVEFLDYDRLRPIEIMLQGIAVTHEIDLVLFFDTEGKLLLTSSPNMNTDVTTFPPLFFKANKKKVGIGAVPADVRYLLPLKKLPKEADNYLCFKSIIPVIQDVGSVYAYIVFIRFIENNSNLSKKIKDAIGSDFIIYNNDKRPTLSSFSDNQIPFPFSNLIKVNNTSYATRTTQLKDADQLKIGDLTVALDNTIFLRNRNHRLILTLLPFLAAVIICIGLLFLLEKRVFKKIRKLARILRNVTGTKDNLYLRMEIQSQNRDRKTLDEVETIALDFNSMMDKLEESYSQIETSNQALQASFKDLERTSGYLSTIILNMADGLLAIDGENKIVILNPTLKDLLKINQTKLEGEHYESVSCDEIIKLIKQVTTYPQKTFSAEIELPYKKIGKATATAILKSYHHGAIVLVRDITEEKAIDQMKTDFISTVSHELRTPLTSILGFASLVLEKLEEVILPCIQTDDKKVTRSIRQVRENLDIIVSEGVRLTTLINDVLDIAKMEAGRIEWKKEDISIPEIINRAIKATASLLENKDIKLFTCFEEELPMVRGDMDRLMQVIINLISNAVKFTDSGSITCRAQIVNEDIKVSVIDTGVGIAREDSDKVFEKFKQVGDVLTGKPKGTGLGLPICKQIIERHKGRIWVESEIGKGSSFSFTIPWKEKEESITENLIDPNNLIEQLKKTVHVGTVLNNNENISRKSVLVVDDDPSIRSLLRQALERVGYEVKEAKDGLEAIEKIKLATPDLIIMDVMMPGISGFDVAAILKNDPVTMDIPIVIASVSEDKERGYCIGIDRYFTKPLDIKRLLTEVEFLIQQGPSKKKILVVDDDTSTVTSLADLFETKGYKVIKAYNGEEGILKALKERPDILIADAILSKRSGMVKAIKLEKGLENILIIMLGGIARKDNEQGIGENSLVSEQHNTDRNLLTEVASPQRAEIGGDCQ